MTPTDSTTLLLCSVSTLGHQSTVGPSSRSSSPINEHLVNGGAVLDAALQKKISRKRKDTTENDPPEVGVSAK